MIGLIIEVRQIHPAMGLKSIYELTRPEEVGRDAFIKIGGAAGLIIHPVRSSPKTTIPHPSAAYPNLLYEKELTSVNQLWTSDITYFSIQGKWYYLTFIMDVYSRRIVGYKAADNLRAINNIDALSEVQCQSNESDYIKKLGDCLNARTEVSVESGRVDLVTDEFAIEVEWAHKWKQSIGQSIWYGLQTHKKPGIIIILRSQDQWKYVTRLGSALKYAGLQQKIKVWIYPIDFPNCTSPDSQALITYQKPHSKEKKYWLTESSKKRHNSFCRYFKKSSGKFCNKNEGIACQICGG